MRRLVAVVRAPNVTLIIMLLQTDGCHGCVGKQMLLYLRILYCLRVCKRTATRLRVVSIKAQQVTRSEFASFINTRMCTSY